MQHQPQKARWPTANCIIVVKVGSLIALIIEKERHLLIALNLIS